MATSVTRGDREQEERSKIQLHRSGDLAVAKERQAMSGDEGLDLAAYRWRGARLGLRKSR